ncbi:MAG: CAP domain-containing protein [Patescibacteria group bacterium]|jgi:uncharacterized protein YkwD
MKKYYKNNDPLEHSVLFSFSLYTTTRIVIAGVAVALFAVAGSVKASPITEGKIVSLINIERGQHGLKPLKTDSDLGSAASLKSRDMINRDYFEHYAFGVSPWDFMQNLGYDYAYAGENLAMDFRTSEGVVNAWMDSPAHRDNILSPEFDDIGVGIVKGEFKEGEQVRETTVVTNMFGRKKTITNRIISKIKRSFIF